MIKNNNNFITRRSSGYVPVFNPNFIIGNYLSKTIQADYNLPLNLLAINCRSFFLYPSRREVMIGLFYNLDTNLELVTFISVPALTAQKIYTNGHQPQVQAQIHHEMEGASCIYAIVEQNSGQCYIGYADTNLA
jgi:hypothetical protein